MSKIIKFLLNANQQIVDLTFRDNALNIMSKFSLSYEYLRIFSPKEVLKAHSPKTSSNTPQVFHKKNVNIINIEPLGKHGYRIIFDDGFNDIYSDNELLILSQDFDKNWQQYINSLSSTNSREEAINFKAVT